MKQFILTIAIEAIVGAIVVAIVVSLTGCTTTQHANYVYLDRTPPVTFNTSSFVLTGYSITNGQPWGGVNWLQGETGEADAKAGRKGNATPANWFKGNFPNMIGDSTTDTKPSDLNFAFMGDLTLEVNGSPVTLEAIGFGQGHNQTGNNWWVGCQNANCSLLAPGVLQFNVDGQCVEFYPEYSTDRFVVEGC